MNLDTPGVQTRTFTLDRKAGKDNVFPAVATTEAPVLRGSYYEVLAMDRIDLSRAPLPFIESHDTGQVNIGVAENMRTDGDKLRCDVRLGNTARAKELAEDIKSGIVSGLSIGYRVFDPIEDDEKDGTPVYRFAYTPYEVSAVSCPADINAGFYRSGNITMKDDKLNRDKLPNQAEDERIRVANIRSMAGVHNLPELGMQGIAEGWSYQEFNQHALTEVDLRSNNARTETGSYSQSSNHSANFSFENNRYDRQLEDYSLTRLLRGLADPKELDKAGLELEISQDMQQVLGRRTKGILIPFEALQQRAITIGGTGSNLVPEDHLSGSFIDVLRNSSRVMSLNPTVLRGLVGNVDIPRKTAGSTAYWIAGDGGDSVTESTPTFDTVSLTPKTVGGAVSFSHKTIVQSSPDIEQLVRQDLADLIASEIDLKSIAGSGSSNQPTGIIATSGIDSSTYANGSSPAFTDYVAMETAISAANGDFGNMAYLLTPALAGTAKITPRQGSGVEGNFVWQGGTINDIAAHKTGNMTAGYAVLGNWSQLLVGFWGGIEIDADPYGSNFLKGSITVRVLADIDFGVRHAAAFAELHEAAP